jgi:CRISPR-associated protein Cas1
MVFYLVHSCLCARGLDPTVGMFHEPGRSHPALASDLVEEFRAPVVDALVIALANREEMTPADFHYIDGTPPACYLKDELRPVFLQAFEDKMASQRTHPDCPYPVDWRRIIDLQVCRFRRFVEGKTDRYQPFLTE